LPEMDKAILRKGSGMMKTRERIARGALLAAMTCMLSTSSRTTTRAIGAIDKAAGKVKGKDPLS